MATSIHNHNLVDTDTHFVIDKTTREISASGNPRIVQYDHNSEVLTFELPRMIDGHDMLECNSVQVHYINICNTFAKHQSVGVYEVTDLKAGDDDTVLLSWVISRNATQYAGSLNFIIKFKCITEDGTVEYAWSTATCKNLVVSESMDNGEAVVKDHSDILAEWEKRIVKGWNDLTDRPFYEETVTVNEPLNITWDGNTEGLVSVADVFYKMSDAVLSIDQIGQIMRGEANALIGVGGGEPIDLTTFGLSANENLDGFTAEVVTFILKPSAVIGDVVFPECGIYFAKADENTYGSAFITDFPVEQTKTVVKTLDEKYMPTLTSPNGTQYKLSVADDGTLTAVAV